MLANFTKLPEPLRYLVAADERGVRWLQPHIHDSPRNQLNSRSIGDGEAHSSRQRVRRSRCATAVLSC
jgi:hypothetical protein